MNWKEKRAAVRHNNTQQTCQTGSDHEKICKLSKKKWLLLLNLNYKCIYIIKCEVNGANAKANQR